MQNDIANTSVYGNLISLGKGQTPKKMLVFTQSYLKGSFTLSERYVTSKWVPDYIRLAIYIEQQQRSRKISLSRSIRVNGP